MHILFAHAGLHRIHRGSEIVFEAVAQEIAAAGVHEVTVAGSGPPIAGRAYSFEHVPVIPREKFERWPKVPYLRSEYMYEDLIFSAALMLGGLASRADLTVGCAYPYTNWALRFSRPGKPRTPHVFVTQNGDWPASQSKGEPKFFDCDGLICTNPIYFERNLDRWRSVLIPNGVDLDRFHPGAGDRSKLGIPLHQPVVLMASALQPGKRVESAIRAVSSVPNAFLLIAGDGILREEVDSLAAKLLPSRYMRKTFPHEQMPEVYRCADVFLHTTIGESFGNIYIEALSSGLPIVAHDEEVTRWILGKHALLVDTRVDDDIVNAIQSLISVSRRTTTGAVAWARERYGWKRVARSYLEFFETVASK